MSRYYGYQPKSTVKSAVELFESKVQRHTTGGTLLPSVYVDILDDQWAVAMAYGKAQHPKLRGPEPVYEVRYVHRPEGHQETLRVDTREEKPSVITREPYASVESFILAALVDETARVSGKSE